MHYIRCSISSSSSSSLQQFRQQAGKLLESSCSSKQTLCTPSVRRRTGSGKCRKVPREEGARNAALVAARGAACNSRRVQRGPPSAVAVAESHVMQVVVRVRRRWSREGGGPSEPTTWRCGAPARHGTQSTTTQKTRVCVFASTERHLQILARRHVPDQSRLWPPRPCNWTASNASKRPHGKKLNGRATTAWTGNQPETRRFICR